MSKISHREPSQHGSGATGNEKMQDFSSPASRNTSVGPGEVPGADQLPMRGPGKAAGGYCSGSKG